MLLNKQRLVDTLKIALDGFKNYLGRVKSIVDRRIDRIAPSSWRGLQAFDFHGQQYSFSRQCRLVCVESGHGMTIRFNQALNQEVDNGFFPLPPRMKTAIFSSNFLFFLANCLNLNAILDDEIRGLFLFCDSENSHSASCRPLK